MTRRPLPPRFVARPVLAWAVAVAVALNLGLAAAAETYPRVRDPLYGDKFVKLQRRVAGESRPAVVVMLGSSRTGLAFHGRRVEEALAADGRRVAAFNFGIPSSGPVTHLVYLNRMLAAGVTPDVLLVEVMPAMLASGPDAPRERHWLYGDRLTASEVDTVARYGFDEPAVRSRWRTTVLAPWYGLRLALMGRVLPSWLPGRVRDVAEWSRGSDDWGFGALVVQDVDPAERAKRVELARAEYGPQLGALYPGGPAGHALRDLIAECRERGITVRLVLCPESSEFRGFTPPEARARLGEFLASLDAPLTDATGWLTDGMFADGHHMTVAGAEAFTDRLTREAIAPDLAARGTR